MDARTNLSRLRLNMVFIWSIIFCSPGTLFAQKRNLHFRVLDHDGMASVTAPYFYRGSRGFLWISTLNGLYRYDGTHARQYVPTAPKDSSTLYPIITSRTYEDNRGDLWFTSTGGIHCYRREADSLSSWLLYAKQDSATLSGLSAFDLDQHGNLWLRADGRLHLFDIGTHRDSVLHDLEGVRTYLIRDRKEKVLGFINSFFNVGLELVRYQRDGTITSKTLFTGEEEEFPKASIYQLLVENETTVWLPSNLGLIKFNPQTLAYELFEATEFEDLYFVDVAGWKSNYLWLASSNRGLFLFDKREKAFHHQDTLFHTGSKQVDLRRINNIFVDEDENLWCSIWNRMVVHANLRNPKFDHFCFASEQKQNLLDHSIRFTFIDRRGDFWCAVANAGLLKFSPKSSTFAQSGMLPETFSSKRRVRQLIEYSSEGLLGLTSEELFWLEVDKQQIFPIRSGRVNFRKLLKLDRKRFLVMRHGDLQLMTRNHGTWSLRPLELPSEVHGMFNMFAHDRKTLFISHGAAELEIYTLEGSALKHKHSIKGIGLVSGFAQQDSLMWMASYRGLVRFNMQDDTWRFERAQNGLLSQSFSGVLTDRSGKLWLSAGNGIFRYDPVSGETNHFTESDGLHDLTGLQTVGSDNKGGRLWFSSGTGLSSIDPLNFSLNTTEPTVQITRIDINQEPFDFGKAVEELEAITLKYNENHFTFEIVAIEFADPQGNKLRYKIEHFHDRWIEVSNVATPITVKLPPGTYNLIVNGFNSDGIQTTAPKQLRITVHPPWWKSWWFYGLCGVLLLLAVLGAYRFQINQIRRKEETKRVAAELKQKEAELKQRAAEYRLQAAETETAILRLQMNPHFIFNSMNSINSYILKKDISKASKYLDRFAKLIRTILDLAAQPYIELGDEIDFLEQYMSIEQMRYEDRFDFAIEVDSDLDPDEVLVPTMILQPFVENAILHGIAHSTRKGLINISFHGSEEQLICSVEDNGIGVEAARRVNDRQKTHESKALRITKRRLELLEEEYKVPTSLEITDRKASGEKSAGTRVRLRLPYI